LQTARRAPAAAARAINPAVVIEAYQTRLDAGNALGLVSGYDLVCDGSDNFATRFLVSDACVLARRTLVSAAVLRFDGQRLRILIERHHLFTGSARARALLEDWDNTLAAFVKVTPKDYRRALLELKAERDAAQMAAAE